MIEDESASYVKIQYLHILFRYSRPALLFKMTYGSFSRTGLTLKQKLDICAEINSRVHENALIIKYQVGKRIQKGKRIGSATVSK